MGPEEPAPASPTPARPARERLRALAARFPPVRLLWVFLAGLGAYDSYYLLGLGASGLVVVPAVAVAVDLLFQRVRFPSLRFPDAAIATGLFVALILPPVAPLLLTATAAVAAIAVRHAFRFRGRPWFNPAATGVLLACLLFGLAPAWWVGIGVYGEVAMVALGLVLVARDPPSWRLPATFILAYGALSVLEHLLVGASNDPRVLLLLTADASTLFFALFMVPEPRTSPRADHERVLYAGVVGVSAALLPIVLPSLGLLVSVVIGNVVAIALRRSSASGATGAPRAVSSGRGKRSRSSRASSALAAAARWSLGRRVAAGFVLLIVLGAVASANPPAPGAAPLVRVTAPGGSGGGGGVSSAACQSDNASIPKSTLTSLHHVLGPSVILSYTSSTNVVVFYDPVNQVTVTETDLFEDYGFAEFNGDDYAVSGCSG